MKTLISAVALVAAASSAMAQDWSATGAPTMEFAPVDFSIVEQFMAENGIGTDQDGMPVFADGSAVTFDAIADRLPTVLYGVAEDAWNSRDSFEPVMIPDMTPTFDDAFSVEEVVGLYAQEAHMSVEHNYGTVDLGGEEPSFAEWNAAHAEAFPTH